MPTPLSPALALRHREALAPRAQVLAARLAAASWAQDFYLAGSAALALYLGHRPVAGLDLMTGTNRLAGPERRDLLAALLATDASTRVETARDGYLYVRLGATPAARAARAADRAGEAGEPGVADRARAAGGTGAGAADRAGAGTADRAGTGAAGGTGAADAGTEVRFFYYPYPLADPPEEIEGLAVASAVDLGLMKLGAIISRGSRRDFVDLYLLCRELPLAQLLSRAGDKFGHVKDFPLQALKGLADLTDLDGEAMPRLAVDVTWNEVAAWLDAQVREMGETIWPPSS